MKLDESKNILLNSVIHLITSIKGELFSLADTDTNILRLLQSSHKTKFKIQQISQNINPYTASTQSATSTADCRIKPLNIIIRFVTRNKSISGIDRRTRTRPPRSNQWDASPISRFQYILMKCQHLVKSTLCKVNPFSSYLTIFNLILIRIKQ